MGHSTQVPDAIFAHPARVLAPTLDIEHLTRLVEKKVFDPQVLEGRELFFFPAEISSDRIDAYFTRMAESSLRQYAREAEEGRSFQNSHRWYELGFGRTLTGELESDEATGTKRVVSWIYTLSGMKLNDLSTDDLITGIRAGLIQDVSIGFYGGEFRCAICGRDMLWDWDCMHVPGLKYQRADKTGEDLAFAWVENAHLAEVSAVYDGATPGAAILKAQREAEEGRLTERGRQLIEARYRVALPLQRVQVASSELRVAGGIDGGGSPKTIAGAQAPATQDKKERVGMSIRDQVVWNGDEGALNRSALEGLLATHEGWEVEQKRLQDALAAAQAEAARIQELEQRATSAEAARAQAQAEIDQLRPMARDGEQYRQDLVAQALAEGVRALGEHFDAGTYQGLLQGASLDVIKRMRDDWQRQADAVFGGGRVTKETHEPPSRVESNGVTAQAFRA